jgi:hypothetical protein
MVKVVFSSIVFWKTPEVAVLHSCKVFNLMNRQLEKGIGKIYCGSSDADHRNLKIYSLEINY